MTLISFQVGDVVRTRAGGPKMTVSFIHDIATVSCMWFDIDDVIRESVFTTDTIEVVV